MVDDERATVKKVRRRLFRWSRVFGRDFWWRRQRDPFTTAVVEILLKQTRASSIEERALAFVARYPNPESLADAPLGQLTDDLLPFGFHRQRAAHLKALGQSLKTGEQVLSADRDMLLALPGIGPYAASAIRCFVYGVREPVIDVNIVRIVERVFGVTYERGEGRRNPEIKRLASVLLQGPNPRKVNWALLDLGALVCRQTRPDCPACPLNEMCHYAKESIAA